MLGKMRAKGLNYDVRFFNGQTHDRPARRRCDNTNSAVFEAAVNASPELDVRAHARDGRAEGADVRRGRP
jgi:hypothetical protein